MKKTLLITLLFTVVVFAQYKAPLTVKGSTTIDSQKAYELFTKKVKFLDVRPIKFVRYGKIKNALHLNVNYFSKKFLYQMIKIDEPFVIYCNGQACPLSAQAIKKAVSYGYKNIYYYRDGFPAWKYYKLPIR